MKIQAKCTYCALIALVLVGGACSGSPNGHGGSGGASSSSGPTSSSTSSGTTASSSTSSGTTSSSSSSSSGLTCRLGGTPTSDTSYTVDATGVSFSLSSARMRLQVCKEDIIRVEYTAAPSVPAKASLSVINAWGTPSFCVTEALGTVTITTSRMKASVNTTTGLVTYSDLNDKLILSEAGKSTTPVTVEGISTNQIQTAFNSPSSEALFGLGQHQDSLLNRKGTRLHVLNANMEINIPFLVSNIGYGILWDNYSTSDFYGDDFSSTKYRYVSEAGEMVDYYFMYGPSIDHVVSLYRTATGAAPLFPKWGYGLFQSKDHYASQAELLSVKDGYRNNNIPVDVIVQDWDYWDPYAWGSHFMDESRYPDPAALIQDLHTANIHTMISVWPLYQSGGTSGRAGEMDNYNALDSAGALYPSGGTHHFYDTFSASARTLVYRQIYDRLVGNYGWDAIWADNTEPQPYPDSLNMRAASTALGKGALFINAYPLQHNKGLYEGWRAVGPNQKRAYILTRSAFAGQQRYAAGTWSGDIGSDFATYVRQIPAGLSYAISGMPYWTTDIGGYFGGSVDWSSAANRELFTRWFQFGAFCPTFRIHGQGARELYGAQWDDATKANLLQIDTLRYRLMPYVYALASKVTSKGYTIMRPLVFDYQADPKVYDIKDQFQFGPAFLVSPVTLTGATARWMYLPAGTWYDFWSGSTKNGGSTVLANAPLSQIPLFVKAGSIVPMGPSIQYATESIDPLEIRLYTGQDGSFTLYEDEGDTYNYESGQSSTIQLSWSESSRKLTIGTRVGSYAGMPTNRTFNIVAVHANHGNGVGVTAAPDQIVQYDGSAQTITVAAAITDGGTATDGGDGSACPSTGLGTLTLCPVAPSPGADDVSYFGGATHDGNNVNPGDKTYSDGCSNDAYTYVAPDRVDQGQTFTTGGSATGYDISTIWVQHAGYTANTSAGDTCSNGTWTALPAGASLTLRVTDPTMVGKAGFTIATETFTAGSNQGWPATPTSNTNGDGMWIRFDLVKPVTVSGNTTYGFDLTSNQGAVFEWLGSINGTLAGASAYNGSTSATKGGPDNAMNMLVGERVFLIQMTPH